MARDRKRERARIMFRRENFARFRGVRHVEIPAAKHPRNRRAKCFRCALTKRDTCVKSLDNVACPRTTRGNHRSSVQECIEHDTTHSIRELRALVRRENKCTLETLRVFVAIGCLRIGNKSAIVRREKSCDHGVFTRAVSIVTSLPNMLRRNLHQERRFGEEFIRRRNSLSRCETRIAREQLRRPAITSRPLLMRAAPAINRCLNGSCNRTLSARVAG